MDGYVLIDTHGDLATLLHRGEARILRGGTNRNARGESQRGQRDVCRARKAIVDHGANSESDAAVSKWKTHGEC